MSCVIERELAPIQKLSGKAAKTGNLQFLKIEVTVYNNTALCVWGEEIILVIKETTGDHDEETEAERGTVTCPKSLSGYLVERMHRWSEFRVHVFLV